MSWNSASNGAVVFVAMELSKSAWLLATQSSPSGKTSSHRLEGGDVAGLLALLRQLQVRETRASGGDVQVIVGHEAGYDGFWLQRRLAAEGITCWVMDPGSLQVDRRARRAKTDRLDAAMLLRALMAWCRGDKAACRMVQVPSVEREDARRTHRERQRLIAERVQHVNRVKGLLATQGIYDFQPLRRDRWARLGEVRTGDGRELPLRLRREIEREFKRLELVLEQIEATETERDTAVAEAAVGDADAVKAKRTPSSAASGSSWRPCWYVRDCSARLPIARRSLRTPGSRPFPSTAAINVASRASRRPATRCCARRWSNSLGCGYATSQTARSRVGLPSASAQHADVSARSPPSPLRGSCWSLCGGILRRGWSPRGHA